MIKGVLCCLFSSLHDCGEDQGRRGLDGDGLPSAFEITAAARHTACCKSTCPHDPLYESIVCACAAVRAYDLLQSVYDLGFVVAVHSYTSSQDDLKYTPGSLFERKPFISSFSESNRRVFMVCTSLVGLSSRITANLF